MIERSRTSVFRLLLVAVVALQFAWCEADVFRGRAFTVWLEGRVLSAIFVAVLYGAVLALLLIGRGTRPRFLRWTVFGFAFLFSVRFHVVRVLNTRAAQRNAVLFQRPNAKLLAPITVLRELSAAQEQYRLRHHTYAASVDSLGPWMSASTVAHAPQIVRHGDTGWSAVLAFDGGSCSIWARDTTLRLPSSGAEGAPACGQEERLRHRSLHSVLAAPGAREVGFRPEDIRGVWSEHRADSSRSGIAPAASLVANGPYRWTTRVGGDLLASVAVAGNQVFVGAHGNGEFDVLTLDSGKVGFRIRVPNWIHHEPVVTPELVIVAFGNNEDNLHGDAPGFGSSPSGIAAYDRRTGIERWRRYTLGSAMTSPVVYDSIVATISTTPEAVGWRVTDGKELWRTTLPSFAPMGNPLLLDTLMFFGLEHATICRLDVRTGRGLFCHDEGNPIGVGGGHASVLSSTGTILLHASDQGVLLGERIREGRWGFALVSLLRFPGANGERGAGHEFTLSEQVLLGLEPLTGRERWRVRLGIGPFDDDAGHIAGTPVVVNGVAYVPSPVSGRVYAVRADSGRVLWWADVHTARGSVLVTRGVVLAATRDSTLVVLDASTGRERCRERLPGLSDRAGPTLAGETGIMTFRNGVVAARPIADWIACRA